MLGLEDLDAADVTDVTGRTVIHPHRNLEHLDQPMLIVMDNQGPQGFQEMPPVKGHDAFDGSRPPIAANGPATKAPTCLVAPFKWALQDPDEYSVGHFHVMTACSFDVSGASFTLSQDPGRWATRLAHQDPQILGGWPPEQ